MTGFIKNTHAKRIPTKRWVKERKKKKKWRRYRLTFFLGVFFKVGCKSVVYKLIQHTSYQAVNITRVLLLALLLIELLLRMFDAVVFSHFNVVIW